MERRNVKSRSKLSFEQVAAICRALLPIGEKVFQYIDQLIEADIQAFIPRWKFTESFCATQDERDLHRRCVVEQARYLLGWPWPPLHLRWTVEDRGSLYASSLLKRLRDERDKENGVSEDQLDSRYAGNEAVWRREIDPCRRRLAIEKGKDWPVYEEHWTSVLEEERRVLEREVVRSATCLATAHTFDKDGRYCLFTAVMERDATPLGFHYDKLKSRPNYPIFSMSISADWDLCWAIEEPNMFFWNSFEGHFMPHLEIRGRNRRGSVAKAEPGEFLQIRYASVVPGFFNAYRTFHSLDELEMLIKAHLCLYRLMAPTINGGLKKVLGEG